MCKGVKQFKIILFIIVMPHEPLSEDNTSCEEEVIMKERYKKNIQEFVKPNLQNPTNLTQLTQLNKEPNKIILNNKKPLISQRTFVLLRR
jgi:glycerate-2-kinase